MKVFKLRNLNISVPMKADSSSEIAWDHFVAHKCRKYKTENGDEFVLQV